MTQKKFERIIYIVLLIVIVLRFTQAYIYQKALREGNMAEPEHVPEFTWSDFNGDHHSIKDLTGKVIVLHFWASWCGPCRQEFPGLLQAAQKLSHDAVFLTITGDDSDNAARKFLAAAKDAAGVKPDNVLYGFDPMKTVTFDVFNTAAYPESIIIDPQMMMRRKLPGAHDWSDPKLLQYIVDLKHPQPVTTPPKAP